MEDTVTLVLKEFESLVKNGEINSFWAAVHKDGLCIQADQGKLKRNVPLGEEMYDSLSTFFYGVSKIEYRSLDYANLICFINARNMLDRLLNKKAS